MRFSNEIARRGALPAILGVLLVAGCPFQEEPFEPGPAGAGGGIITGVQASAGVGGAGNVGGGGAGNAGGESETGGGQTSGSSSGDGAGGGPSVNKECAIPDGTKSIPLSFYDPIMKSDRCYARSEKKATWADADTGCKGLKSGGMLLNANLVSISGLEEHTAVRDWLVQGLEDAWTRGNRIYAKSFDEPGAFFWGDSGESWQIFPCAVCICDECKLKEKVWANWHGAAQQPNGFPSANEDTGYCVRYAVSSPEWYDDPKAEFDGHPGLDDRPCDDSEYYVCEWQIDLP